MDSFIEWLTSGEGLLFVVSFIAIILLLREVFTWFWKLSEIVTLLRYIERNTRIMANKILKEEGKPIVDPNKEIGNKN